ncbi:MAG: hypothetical protein SFH39_00085 [Candidatus Magnetobacterium sp. LHC-1]
MTVRELMEDLLRVKDPDNYQIINVDEERIDLVSIDNNSKTVTLI